MSEEATPEKLFEAYRDVTYKLQRDGENMDGVYIPPATYAEVDEQRKRIFEQNARELNRMLAGLDNEEKGAHHVEV